MSLYRPRQSGRSSRVDLNLVATLQAIMDTGNVSKAAIALGVTQPAISQSLRKLREHFGDELFVRSGNSLKPTPRMLALQPVIARLLCDLDILSRPPDGFDPATAEQEFIVCLSEVAEFAVLPSVAAEFALHAPQCRIRGIRVHHSQLLSMLEQGEVDLAAGSLAGAAPSLRQQRLAEHRVVCMVSAQGRWSDTQLTLQDYIDGRHVSVRRIADTIDPISERLLAAGIHRNAVATVSSDFVAAQTIVKTDAICTVGEPAGRQLAALFPVKLLPVPFNVGTLTARMIWHQRFQRDASHIWLRKLIETAYRNWASPND
ncbi:LysR family transcriptional regulator [Burkholderia pseudomultivorans]|uniref:LysR family transcriptional regulator n=1 Tax=Burkholderia pseudomultivorans TaxID=1207504 RepID=UPI00075C8C2E|nr:LysR family transcriptional regulator [Burkholderia pseudomultivorans]AOI94100.1 LysR family transcriptional regulator [Burkholderia pseudomultivorans]KVC27744.1 LysR family transcriptional regulator [Burkholderia pseudomultivorans]KVC36866.1 LysR family transcriptional regulator [Burkholderia pseudomultivorans]KVC42107.1 LysR family transcriptional regulator [Burkholderia pseudomultivorans]